MTFITLIGVISLVSGIYGQQVRYVDYDYQDIGGASPVAPPSRANYARAVAATPRIPAQSIQPRPTPVPILKQINRHNDDGSYTYGYEGADGSFKIETKLPTGEVMGKYGYVDDTGKLRVIEYGANRYGFQPAGEGITVAPPTLVDETAAKEGKTFSDYEDEQIYAAQPGPQAPQKRPQIFTARAHSAPARSYSGFEQQIRPVATPSYDENLAGIKSSAAPARFASRRPSQVRFASQHQLAEIPQHIPQQVPQHIPQQVPQHIPQQVPQHIPQQVPQHITHQVPHIPQAAPQSPVPQRAIIPGSVPVGQVFTPASAPTPRPIPVREDSRSSSGILLDQLEKQYALPAGVGQPLHDITFGSYSSQTNY